MNFDSTPVSIHNVTFLRNIAESGYGQDIASYPAFVAFGNSS